MFELQYTKHGVNLGALHKELKERFEGFVGGSTGPGGRLWLFFERALTESEELEVRMLVEMHDPAVLSEEQKKERDRRVLIEQLKAKPWADWTGQDRDDLLRVMAVLVGIDSFAESAGGT